MSTRKEIVSTPDAPRAIGPYSQAVKIGPFLFTSGQIPLDPGTGEIVAGGIVEQTERVMRNVAAVLEAAGAGFAQVVKTTVFLADIDDFAAMNEVYGRYFNDTPPARSTIQAAKLPRGARVEIETVAWLEG